MRLSLAMSSLGLASVLALSTSCGRTSRDFAEDGEPGAASGSGFGGEGSEPSPAAAGESSTGGKPAGGPNGAGAPPTDPGSGPAPVPDPEPEPEPEPKPEPVPTPDCSRRSESHTDPSTNQKWSTAYYCGNDRGAKLYEGPSYGAHVATMDSVSSWFVCYARGQQHAGNNNVWYYTQGDRATAGWGSRSGWGYMAAVNVHTRNDPDPGIPACSTP